MGEGVGGGGGAGGEGSGEEWVATDVRDYLLLEVEEGGGVLATVVFQIVLGMSGYVGGVLDWYRISGLRYVLC